MVQVQEEEQNEVCESKPRFVLCADRCITKGSKAILAYQERLFLLGRAAALGRSRSLRSKQDKPLLVLFLHTKR
ncbi:MAG: hypothetical protein IKB31_09810 [Bacteroidaceae bacterium]|nr:hypothetical protein [Bacteroidaceae bacterium]